LRPQDEFFRALSGGEDYTAAPPFATAAPVPEASWKADPRRGHLLVEIRDRNGQAADGARLGIAKLGVRRSEDVITMYADGNGYAGAVDLSPGSYLLAIGLPGAPGEVAALQRGVMSGRVTRTRVVLPTSLPRLSPDASDDGPPVVGAGRRGPILRFDERLDSPFEASALEEWRTREPVPEDIVDRRREARGE
jgi:hypothetical protein